MRKPLIAGNWKMNLLYSKVPEYLQTLSREINAKSHLKRDQVDVLLAVPAPFLGIAREYGEKNGILIASQTVHEKADGAFTGELSIPMLKDLGIRWTLIGHSERRQYYNETDAAVALKTKACLDHGINAIVCVGETRAEREGNQTETVLKRQLEAVLQQTGKADNFVIAYEPVWAIGTGLTASDEQAQAAHAFIRTVLRQKLGGAADGMRILYGGSVKSSNIKGLMQQPDVDGALVGGASLDPVEFARIVDCQ
ncbi:MAG TPA: triose-phosphate isomerase [Oligoflexus sp.]|uniref:triose-phosphate isomerase n=1 Tax=Oligoflexus sp. TaxID=1971216 RepID=UPI002D58B510|nr:triose-phosphate isomerase [Oligoflexus sp.]HYX38305.1 triose-phosphate isomerase [Oligoflexus sp.]